MILYITKIKKMKNFFNLNKKLGFNTSLRKFFSQKISNKIIGIDLGTTNSCVAIAEGNSTKVIENNEGMRTLPSFVAFGEDGNQLVGLPAKRQVIIFNKINSFSQLRILTILSMLQKDL
jgi:molecular chaperone DnaK (HSP70)